MTNDVYPSIRAYPQQSGYLVSIGAGQDGQWSWWISGDVVLAAIEITALRDRAVSGIAADRDAALTVPWAYGEEIAWHELPSGNVSRHVDPAPIVDDDDEVQHLVDLGNGCLLIVTGEGHALRVDQPEERPIIADRMPPTGAPNLRSDGPAQPLSRPTRYCSGTTMAASP